MPVPSPRQPPVVSLGTEAPTRRALGWLAVVVLALHLALLLSLTSGIDWRLKTDEAIRVAPLQTRWIAPQPPQIAPLTNPAASIPRTRLATEPRKPQTPVVAESAIAAPPVTADAQTPESAEPTLEESLVPAATVLNAPTPNKDTPTNPQTAAIAPTSEPEAMSTASSVTPPTTPAAVLPESPIASTTPSQALPPIPLGALPPPVLLSYRLTGQEKGLNYYANGELRWQHNESAYALSLSVKAFLIGARHWRSQGEITAAGLAPRRFSDSWRSERAAHFDRAQNRVVFSNNAPIAALEPGAQDQISLYVQLAAAMAGEPKRFQPGTRLQVQTATIRDALPWLLTLGPEESLQMDGETLQVVKWVCQPRNRFDATVEFWVSAQHAWMPVRIRITQLSGSFIDLTLRSREPLPPLPLLPKPAPA